MKKRFLIPVMAMFLAVGMSFATTNPKGENEVQALDYYKVGGTWHSVAEQDCGEGIYTCRVQFGGNGTPHDLYDNMGDIKPKPSGTSDPVILP